MMAWRKIFVALMLGSCIAAWAGERTGAVDRDDRKDQTQCIRRQRQRCYEIMVLLQTYRMLPEANRPPVKKEIMTRLREDCLANRGELLRAIADARRRLARLEAEADTPVESRVEREFARLLALMDEGRQPRCLRNMSRHVPPEVKSVEERENSSKKSACERCRGKKDGCERKATEEKCEFGQKYCNGKIN